MILTRNRIDQIPKGNYEKLPMFFVIFCSHKKILCRSIIWQISIAHFIFLIMEKNASPLKILTCQLKPNAHSEQFTLQAICSLSCNAKKNHHFLLQFMRHSYYFKHNRKLPQCLARQKRWQILLSHAENFVHKLMRKSAHFAVN